MTVDAAAVDAMTGETGLAIRTEELRKTYSA